MKSIVLLLTVLASVVMDANAEDLTLEQTKQYLKGKIEANYRFGQASVSFDQSVMIIEDSNTNGEFTTRIPLADIDITRLRKYAETPKERYVRAPDETVWDIRIETIDQKRTITWSSARHPEKEHWNQASLSFKDADFAGRIAKALIHAAILSGAREDSDPFR